MLQSFFYKKYLYIYNNNGELKEEYKNKIYKKIKFLEEKYNINYDSNNFDKVYIENETNLFNYIWFIKYFIFLIFFRFCR